MTCLKPLPPQIYLSERHNFWSSFYFWLWNQCSFHKIICHDTHRPAHCRGPKMHLVSSSLAILAAVYHCVMLQPVSPLKLSQWWFSLKNYELLKCHFMVLSFSRKNSGIDSKNNPEWTKQKQLSRLPFKFFRVVTYFVKDNGKKLIRL